MPRYLRHIFVLYYWFLSSLMLFTFWNSYVVRAWQVPDLSLSEACSFALVVLFLVWSCSFVVYRGPRSKSDDGTTER
jgi:hypothetical protein